ncbi:glycosyltransferase [Peribacillus sp. V2I11]|uniref:glycosyltransferase n=1 Tax=Peribacillus sp. V2I11 TaxID=3042277 RepID=UPI0027887415|nr:glycosyltransferase [Peribacillus sp. V2I11]MDQ0883017.1 glycosyltransferase involved in cell wall biosynthesis [Peribacillus sp. V2I11]
MDKNLDVLFLGGLFPKEKENDILNYSRGSIQNAANNLQWGIALGLDANLNKPIKILNSLYIGSFPKRYKKLCIDTYPFSHTQGANEDINVGFLNLTGIKNFSRFLTLKPYVKKWAEKETDKKKVIIAYAMTPTFTYLLNYAKKINNNIITCLIVPDLPQYMNLSSKRNKLYDSLKKLEIKQISKDMNYIDSYVLLTKYMRDALNLNISKPTVVIEGIATDVFKHVESISKEKGIKTVLYSGGLAKKYGIIELLNAFGRLSNENYRLIICGSGEAEYDVIEAGKKDSRIIFKGLLPREEVLKLQKSSTILVNPRPNNEEYTKYSFPSKIMEYLSSGVPMVGYKLDGMPSEYSDYFFPIKVDDDGFYKTLNEVLSKSKDELDKKGFRAKEFVLTYKNQREQAAKIIQMLNGVEKV